MKFISERYTLKISKNISIIYSKKKKMITLIGPLIKKSIKLNVQLFIIKSKNILKVSALSFFKMSNNKKKKIKTLQGTTFALIKQLIIETSTLLYYKLKFIGVGYRAFYSENFENKLLIFKIGYSHFLYFKVPKK